VWVNNQPLWQYKVGKRRFTVGKYVVIDYFSAGPTFTHFKVGECQTVVVLLIEVIVKAFLRHNYLVTEDL
jgi:hypothetical protein